MAFMWRIIAFFSVLALVFAAVAAARTTVDEQEQVLLKTVVDDDEHEPELLFKPEVQQQQEEEEEEQVYIVHADATEKPPPYLHLHHWYDSLSPKIVYKYSNVLHGFAARLTPREAEVLQDTRGILLVQPQELDALETTRSPAFLNLASNVVGPDGGENIIIGVIDSGIDAGNPSFGDTGMPPKPARWKGSCTGGITCNNKLIGAKYFGKASTAVLQSPVDVSGHGTHCASIAAGNEVPNVNFLGYANGTARGMAQKSWLAVYKVCWPSCAGADVLAGIEHAIDDGVDVMSISLGSNRSLPLYRDSKYMGTLAAAQKGIFVSSSAGNYGPETVGKVAPWITTVAAGSIDREFKATVTIGDSDKNTKTFSGKSFSGVSLPRSTPLVYFSNGNDARRCRKLDPADVKGKIVVCDVDSSSEDRIAQGRVVRDAGGSGMVLANSAQLGSQIRADYHVLPAVHVDSKAGTEIRKYFASSPGRARASLQCSVTVVGIKDAPKARASSSRGPNSVIPGLLKPDVMAPGSDILAAFPSYLPVTGPNRTFQFVLKSGTSMAAPHVAGVAAILKATHPDWSEAKIRSALMTTAYVTARDGKPIQDLRYPNRSSTPYVHGSGYIDPAKASDPGLVYDAAYSDYVKFVCSLGYSDSQVSIITRGYKCTQQDRGKSVGDFNYPSFVADFRGGTSSVTYSRSVTNVGKAPATYAFTASMPSGVKATVDKPRLNFTQSDQTVEYKVTFEADALDPSLKTKFGHLQWSDGVHNVRSPVAFLV